MVQRIEKGGLFPYFCYRHNRNYGDGGCPECASSFKTVKKMSELPRCPRCFSEKLLYKILGKFRCANCIDEIKRQALDGEGEGKITNKENKLLNEGIVPKNKGSEV